MLAFLLVVIGSLLLIAMGQSGYDYVGMEQYMRARYQRAHLVEVAEGLESYVQERAAFPASLQALVAAPGFEDLRFALERRMGLALSAELNDGTWRFQRAVAFLLLGSPDEDAAGYLARNYCGSGGALTALSWCGAAKTSLYYRRETRDYVNEELTTQQVRLIRLQQKFVRYYNAHQAYPAKDTAEVPLVAGEAYALAELAGYGGTAADCAGVHHYQGIPIDCRDMFDRWGGRVAYQFEGSGHVIFTSEPPVFNAAGERVIVAVDRN